MPDAAPPEVVDRPATTSAFVISGYVPAAADRQEVADLMATAVDAAQDLSRPVFVRVGINRRPAVVRCARSHDPGSSRSCSHVPTGRPTEGGRLHARCGQARLGCGRCR